MRLGDLLHATSLIVLLWLFAAPARAETTLAEVGPPLALLGLAGGAAAGAIAGWRSHPRSAFWPGFGVYLGLLSVTASTRAGSLEVVPLTLVLGAGAGILPFALAWFALRAGVAALQRAARRRRG